LRLHARNECKNCRSEFPRLPAGPKNLNFKCNAPPMCGTCSSRSVLVGGEAFDVAFRGCSVAARFVHRLFEGALRLLTNQISRYAEDVP
jgi:hypothetical protein